MSESGVAVERTTRVTPDAEVAARVEALLPRLVDTRRDLHAHPELSNREFRTGKIVAEEMRRLGLEVRHPVAKTGVVAVLRGAGDGRVVGVRADLDALPVEERNEAPYRSQNPGVMHACGHDAHTAIAIGVAQVLGGLKAHLPGTVVFLFQPAEEGAPEGESGGAASMIVEGALDSPPLAAVFGLHVDPALEVGRVGWTAGAVFASTDVFTIEIEGRRTHGAYPHTGIDPIPVAAEIVTGLQSLLTRRADAQKPKVLTIGTIHGGERANIVAERVRMEGSLRTLDPDLRVDLKSKVASFVEQVAAAHGARGSLRFRGAGIPALRNDAALAQRTRVALVRALGDAAVVDVEAQMGSEDFALYAARAPVCFLKLGVRNEARGITAMLHSERFDLDEAAIGVGVRALAAATWDELLVGAGSAGQP
jgi:amidohydrolase